MKEVNCNWCGEKIESPEEMLNLKHMCYECFKKVGKEIKIKKKIKLHIDMPTKEVIEDSLNLFDDKNETPKIPQSSFYCGLCKN